MSSVPCHTPAAQATTEAMAHLCGTCGGDRRKPVTWTADQWRRIAEEKRAMAGRWTGRWFLEDDPNTASMYERKANELTAQAYEADEAADRLDAEAGEPCPTCGDSPAWCPQG